MGQLGKSLKGRSFRPPGEAIPFGTEPLGLSRTLRSRRQSGLSEMNGIALALWRLVGLGGEFVFICYPKNVLGVMR